MAVEPHRDNPAPPAPSACLLVALAAAALACLTIFNNLGVPRMEPDEGYYALATDSIRETGQWLSVHIHPDRPYFNKPPLYMWLSALTYDLLPGFELKYRAWSAAFGVLAVALTAALGTRLFRPAVGMIAGCLLATNRSFLFEHGARFGGMDAALTACFALILLLYWRTRGPWSEQRLGRWAVIGAIAGVATLFKPLAGAPMLALVGLHALSDAASRGRPIRARPALVAVATAVLVGTPWYVVQLVRFGTAFTRKLFGEQLADRVAGIGPAGEHKGWAFYLTEVPQASNTFLVLLVPALVWSAVALARRPAEGDEAQRADRSARALLLMLVVGWVGAFSLSSGKFLHYAYPIFPAITIAIAAMLADLVGRAGRRLPLRSTSGERLAPAAASRAAVATMAAGFAAYAGYVAAVQVPREGSPLPAWSAYRLFQPAIEDGRVALLFWDVAHTRAAWPSETAVRPNAMIYLSHMAGGTGVRDAAELSRRLAERRPTIVVYRRGADLSRVPELLPAAGRVDPRFSMDQRTYALAAVDVGPVVHTTLRAGVASPYLRVADGPPPGADAPLAAFVEKVAVEVTAPLPQPTRLTFVVRAPPGEPPRTVVGLVSGGADVPPFRLSGTHRITVVAGRDENANSPKRTVTFELRPGPGDSGPAVRAELVEVNLEVCPVSPLGQKGPEPP